MPLKEYKKEKMYYSMGEVAEMFDVNASLIRFWEQRFDVLKPKKNKKGNRLFTPADVKNLETIYHLVKERGMTLSGAEKYMKANRGNVERETEIIRKLHEIRALLQEIREELKDEELLLKNASSLEAVSLIENNSTFECSEPGQSTGCSEKKPNEPESEQVILLENNDREDSEDGGYGHKVPFEAQPLFEIENSPSVPLKENPYQTQIIPDTDPLRNDGIIDTQQSLF